MRERENQDWRFILSIVIALSSLIYAVYAHRENSYRRKPVFWTDPSRVEILNAKHLSEAPIKVIRTKDDSEIVADLVAVRFYFWNAGRKPIKKIHIIEEPKVTISDPESEIIDFRVLKMSRDPVKFRLMPGQKDNEVVIQFQVLEQNDGAACQIIYTGEKESRLAISGFIEESGNIEMPPQTNRVRRLLSKRYLILIFIIFVFIYILTRWIYGDSARRLIRIIVIFAYITYTLFIVYQTLSNPNIPQCILP